MKIRITYILGIFSKSLLEFGFRGTNPNYKWDQSHEFFYSEVSLSGSLVQLGVSTSLMDITKGALGRFTPYERRCWAQDEVQLEHLDYQEGYR